MSAIAVPSPVTGNGSPVFRIGRPFVHPAFDLVVIGGGLSLVLLAFLIGGVRPPVGNVLTPSLALLILLSNQAHFAASTVRLYTKPGARRELRFLSLGFPLVALAVLSLAVARPEHIGANLMALYLTWSPFHYGAQAYGLSLMYAYRSGCSLSVREKQILRAACLAPFLALLVGGRGIGLDWLLSQAALPAAWALRSPVGGVLAWAPAVLVLGLLLRMAVAGRATLPLISICVVISNFAWLLWFPRVDAFAYATVFHALQYLAIVTIFHVKNQQNGSGATRGWAYLAGGFYLRCLILGYVLFQILPLAYVLLGFGLAESALLVVTIINLHHFLVDAYIWKLRQGSNYKLVTDVA
jgi:hypothetical protein